MGARAAQKEDGPALSPGNSDRLSCADQLAVSLCVLFIVGNVILVRKCVFKSHTLKAKGRELGGPPASLQPGEPPHRACA